VLYHTKLVSSLGHQTHDVQVTAEGKILYFNNVSHESAGTNRHSSIDLFDPLTTSTETVFSATPKAMFFSSICGGVQELDEDHLLFSDYLNGTYLYSRKTRELTTSLRETHYIGGRYTPSQQVKAVDAGPFLGSRQ
jgi:hypothetical protein